MRLRIKKALVEEFCTALERNQPLDPARKWDQDHVLAALAAVCSVSEHYFQRIRPRNPRRKDLSLRSRANVRRAKSQLAQFARQCTELCDSLGREPDVITVTVDDDPE
jgi:hypothetical protein